MLPTSIRHGDLVVDFQSDGSVQIVRQSNASGIVLSLTEFEYLTKVAALHEFPMAPPSNCVPELNR